MTARPVGAIGFVVETTNGIFFILFLVDGDGQMGHNIFFVDWHGQMEIFHSTRKYFPPQPPKEMTGWRSELFLMWKML
jgi:hypothetical protein